MKWFQHQSNAYTDIALKEIVADFGMVGYGFYWICCELVAQQGKNYVISSQKSWKNVLKLNSALSSEKIDELLERFAKLNLISKKSLLNGALGVPKMKNYSDNFTKYPQSHFKVTSKSLQSHFDKIRIDKNRIDKIGKDDSRKSKTFPKEWQTSVLNSYKKFKGISPQGNEWLPLQQECKSMFLSGRTPKEIIACMKFFSEDDFYKSVWTLKTVRLKLPEFVGKLASKEKQKEKHKVEQQEFDKIIELSDEQRAENIGKLDKMKSFLKEKLST